MFTSLICLLCSECRIYHFQIRLKECRETSTKRRGRERGGGPTLHIWCAHAPWSRFTADPGWADVVQRIHATHCHAGPCQRSSEGACRSFSSSALINMLLIGCWRDSRDDWLLWHSGPLFDFVEPYWNQSEAVQIARFVMTLVEGVVNRWWHRLRINISHIKHPGLHAPFFLLSGVNIKSCCQHRNYKSRYTEGGARRLPDGNIHFCAFVSLQYTLLMGSLSLCLPIFRTEVNLRVCIHISVDDNEVAENKGWLGPWLSLN